MSDPQGAPGAPIVSTGGAATPTADGKSSDPTVRQQRSAHDQLLDELIFKQDLNEVHLLIDFVSGRADRSLSTLTMPNPHKDSEYPGDTLSSGDIVTRIAKMRYPPDENPVVNSQNAAILLLAKDRLSALASPARGLTVAYTAMFVGAEGDERLARVFGGDWLAQWRARRRDRKAGMTTAGDTCATSPALPGSSNSHRTVSADRGEYERRSTRDSRIDLAAETFPGLLPHARQFRKWRDFLAHFSLLWLALTGLTYWDVALGRSVLEHLDQNWKSRAAMVQATPELATENRCASSLVDGETPRPGDAAITGADVTRIAVACGKLRYLDRSREEAHAELDRVFRCEGMWFSVPVHVWCWRWMLSGRVDPAIDRAGTIGPPPNHLNWQSATSVLSVFTVYILPMMFGLMGTLIGALRSIVNKVGDGELAPRDLVRMKLGIPMGLVAGIAVGLFFSPSSVPVQGAGGVAGDLTLTASGLGFLAGYGSHTFFRFIDDLLQTVFPENRAANASAARPAPVPGRG